MIQVVNIKTYKASDYPDSVQVYIGRAMPRLPGSPLGNPFKLRLACEREATVAKYETWLRTRLEADTPQRREIERLADYAENLVLACWCAPKLCHGDVVKKVIEERLAARRPDTWDAINERRCALIRKNVNRTITPEESEELARLQQLADERIRELAPLPIAELEAYMRAHGIEIDEAEND